MASPDTRTASKMSSKPSDAQTVSAADAASGNSAPGQCRYNSIRETTLPESSMTSSGSEKSDGYNDRPSSAKCKPQDARLKLSSLRLASGGVTPVQRTPTPYRRTFSIYGHDFQLLPSPAAPPRARRGSLEYRSPSTQGPAVAGVHPRTPQPRNDGTSYPCQRRHSVESTPFTASYSLGTSTRPSLDLPKNASPKSILKGGGRPRSCAPRRSRSLSGSVAARPVSSLGHREPLQGGGASMASRSARSKSPAARFSYKLDPNLSCDVKRVTFNDDVAVVGGDGIRRRRHSSPSLVVMP